MAQSKYIQSLKRAVGGRELSRKWYRKKIVEFGKPTSAQLVREGRRKATPFIGKLNMFITSNIYYKLARPGGLEPPTLGLENRCSIH